MAKRWYVVHVYSGFEKKIAQQIKEQAAQKGLGEQFDEILVPSEEVTEVRRGQKVNSERKFFPGYVLVKMEMSDEAWHVVKNTPKVTGFVGTGRNPTPLTQSEVDQIVEQVVTAKEKPKPKYVFEKGEMVKIVDGPFNNFTGVVDDINVDRGTLKVMVTIFGRQTPVELEFLQVQKA